MNQPTIRALDMQRVVEDEQRGVVLTDRLRISEPIFVPEQLLPIVGRCTGERDLEQIRKEAELQFGEPVSLATVQQVVDDLDRLLLLVGPRFDAAATEAVRAFMATGVRPASHAGSAGYPADPPQLREALDRMLDAASTRPAPPTPLRGLVAPHIDLARGAAGYGAAYRALLGGEAIDLYVVFGTGHAGPSAPVTGLSLDWQTPLGRVTTDRDFVAAVHQQLGEPEPLDLLIHRDEHSLEFQVLWLQHLHQRHFGDRPFRVACFLCGPLPSADGDPLRESWLQSLLEVFRTAARASIGRVCYIAGADLAHLGPFFGDEQPIDDHLMQRLAVDERDRLAHLERGAPGPFHRAVADCGNPDRVCSGPAITLCAALAGGSGQLLHYGQARADDDSQVVSFCAMTFAGDDAQ